MTIVEKFYSDALRRIAKCSDSAFRQELCTFFVQTIRTYDKSLLSLAQDVAEYWSAAHPTDTAEEALNWFYAVFALFDGNFTDDMDFSDKDWNELCAIVSAAADTLDMHTVSTMMGVMVDRHKIE